MTTNKITESSADTVTSTSSDVARTGSSVIAPNSDMPTTALSQEPSDEAYPS
jgi:hypothetical protein